MRKENSTDLPLQFCNSRGIPGAHIAEGVQEHLTLHWCTHCQKPLILYLGIIQIKYYASSSLGVWHQYY